MAPGMTVSGDMAVQFRLPTYAYPWLGVAARQHRLGVNEMARCYVIAAAWGIPGHYVAQLIAIAATRQQNFLTVCELLTEKIRTVTTTKSGRSKQLPSAVVASQLQDLAVSSGTSEPPPPGSATDSKRCPRIRHVAQLQFRVPAALGVRLGKLQKHSRLTHNEICRRLVVFAYWNLPPHQFERIDRTARKSPCDFETICTVVATTSTVAARCGPPELSTRGTEVILSCLEQGVELRDAVQQASAESRLTRAQSRRTAPTRRLLL